MIDLKEGASVKVTPLDNKVFPSREPIIGKVFKLNPLKTEMIVVGYQNDRLEGRLIPISTKRFLIEKTRIPKLVSDRIEVYTRTNFYKIPINDMSLCKNTYREVLTKNFGIVTVFNVKEYGPDTLVYKYYALAKNNQPVVKALRVNFENGVLVSEGVVSFKNYHLKEAQQIHAELKVGKEQKVYVISHKDRIIFSTENKEELYWNVYKFLLNKEMINILDLGIFTNKI